MDGIEVVFRVALAILHLAKTELLSLDMEGMLKVSKKPLQSKIVKALSSVDIYAF